MSAPEVVAGAVAIWVVLFAPGVAVGYALGLRGLAAWALGPALTCSLVGLGGAAAALAGIRWSPVLFVLLTAILVAVAAAVSRLLPPRVTADARPARAGAVVGVLLGAAFIGVAMLRSMGSLLAVPAQPDATYHLNSIRTMLVTGNISSRDGGAFLYDRAHSFYPSTFQGIAATAGLAVNSVQPVALANLLALAAGTTVWTGGCVLLARQTFGPRRAALVLAGLAAASFTAMPFFVAGYGPLWPLLLGMALLPGLLAAVLSVAGLARRDAIGRPRALVVLVVAVAGLALVHPDALAGFALFGYVVLAAVVLSALVRRRGTARRTALLVGALVGPPVVWAAVLHLPRVRAMTRAYAVGPVESHARGLSEALLNNPRFAAPLWVTSAVALLGVVVCARQARTRWVSAAYVVAALVFFGVVAVQSSATQAVTVFWYNDPPRLAALVPVAGVPAVTAGLLAVVSRLQPDGGRRRGAGAALAVGVLFVAGTLGNNYGAHVGRMRPYYAPKDAGVALLTRQEAHALQQLARSLPSDAVVADNPWRGQALLYAFTSRKVVFYSEKAVTTADRATVADALFLAASPLHPDVCRAVRAVGATYVITGGSNELPNLNGRDAFLGIDLVPGRPGFQQVATSAPYTLWRITACG
jgi:hypothetical protein